MLHEAHIQHCYQLAKAATLQGNHPFAALIAVDEEVLLSQQNTVVTSGDPTQHAELELLRKAVLQIPKSTLKQATLYTSTEPCAMCSGAIYWAGIRQVVFG